MKKYVNHIDFETGNEKIAKWFGYEKDSWAEPDETPRYFIDDHLICTADGVDYWDTFESDWTSWCYPKDMKFHSEWNWLKPVIDRIIESIGIKTIDSCLDDEWFQIKRITDMRIGVNIDVAYDNVIGYIDWDNRRNNI